MSFIRLGSVGSGDDDVSSCGSCDAINVSICSSSYSSLSNPLRILCNSSGFKRERDTQLKIIGCNPKGVPAIVMLIYSDLNPSKVF